MPKQHNEIIDTHTLHLSAVIHGGFVKLNVLQGLVFNTYGNSSIAAATEVNVFIDLNNLLHPLYSEHNRVVYDNITDISSEIINMCGHYRSFFRQLGVSTNFYLINSLNTCEFNRKFIASYNDKFKAKTEITALRNVIDNNMSLLKILCPYLPRIYYIQSTENWEVGVIIAHLIETLNKDIPNLIISHDLLTLQLVPLYRWTSFLFPKKYHGEDLSTMLPIYEKPGFREQFWNMVCNVRKIKAENYYDLSPVNFSLFTALTMCPERSISGLYTPIVAKKFIMSLVNSEDIKILPDQILNNPDLAEYAVADICSRYEAIDYQYALPFFRASTDCKNINLIDLQDDPTVNKISSKYYVNNPLELNKL